MEFHVPTLAAETIGHIGSFPLTNSLINAVLASVFLIAIALLLRRKLKPVPQGAQSLVEVILEGVLNFMDSVTQDRRRSLRFLPIVGTLFVFILFSNWIGVLPGVGSIVVHSNQNGHPEVLPFFRPANADLNLTIAMAVLAVVASHIFGVMAIGFWKYGDRFIRLGTLWKSLRKGGVNVAMGFIEVFIGFIEIIGEIAKIVSLSLRLFGNIFAGEVLLTIVAALVAYVAPLPFLLLEFLVGFIQATVFAMLTLVYLTLATTDHAESHS